MLRVLVANLSVILLPEGLQQVVSSFAIVVKYDCLFLERALKLL